jgi:hypothetical protein
MEHLTSQQSRAGLRLFLASVGPLILLFAYLFVFRWSERTFLKADDYGALIVCSLVGTIIIAMQPVRIWWCAVAITCHIAFSMALFGWWRFLSRPVLNDIF